MNSDETSAAETADDTSVRHWSASLALAVAVAALIAAIVCLGFFGYHGVRAYAVDSGRDQLRTDSVAAAEQAVLNITSIDPAKLPEWKKALDSTLTGDARKQVDDNELKRLVGSSDGKAGRIESRVLRSAATEVNTDENTSTVLVYATVKSVLPGQQPAEQVMGFLLTMVDVDGTQKASKVTPLDSIEYEEVPGQTPGQEPTNQQGGGN